MTIPSKSPSWAVRAPIYRLVCSILVALSLLCQTPQLAAQAKSDLERKAIDVKAGDALQTLRDLSAQAGGKVIYSNEAVAGVKTHAVKGHMRVTEALEQMLAGTGLVARVDDRSGAIAVRKETTIDEKNVGREASRNDRPQSDEVAEKKVELPVFEVMGSKLLNMDIPRSRDDAQPYVVFDHATIERSGATNLEDFFKNRLPMNTVSNTGSQQQATNGNTSAVNLRGLGTNQTLILIDGRRAPSTFNAQQGALGQPDLNGIPLAAIERIEVLPTTASGIYGGSAMGGVINIIMRRDYAGVEVSTTYENSIGTDTGGRRLNIAAGFNLESGKTNFLLAAEIADRNPLAVWDRGFTQDYRYRALALSGSNYQSFNSGSNPPFGSTTNIRSSNGSNLVLKTGTPLNAPITFVPASYAGTPSDGGAAFAANAGRYNLTWGDSPLSGTRGILSGSKTDSINATLRRDFTDSLQVFVEGSTSRNASHQPAAGNSVSRGIIIPATSPNNPFSQDIRVTFPISVDDAADSAYYSRRLAAGIILKLSDEWKAEGDYVWGQSFGTYSSSQTVFAQSLSSAVASGSVNVLRDQTAFPLNLSLLAPSSSLYLYVIKPARATLKDATIRLAGPAVVLPAGPISLSASLEHRDEDISGQSYFNSASFLVPPRSQTVESGYMELAVPFISERNALPGVHSLRLQLSGRYDSYSTHGATSFAINPTSSTVFEYATNKVHSVDPTVAILYQPAPDLSLRASYGTGFLAPNVQQVVPLAGNDLLEFYGLVDPRRGSAPIASGELSLGGNPALKPELSHSVSLGAIFQPHFLPRLRVSVDYTRIRKTDAIFSPDDPQVILNNETILPSRVVRAPLTAADQALGYTGGTVTFIDGTLLNLSHAAVDAFDVQIDYEAKTLAWGTWDLFAVGTIQPHYRTQVAPSTPESENSGYYDTNSSIVLRFRGNLGVTWKSGNWTLGWTMRYFDSYLAYSAADSAPTVALRIKNQGSDRVASQSYHDLVASYRFATRGKEHGIVATMLAGTEVTFGVTNVFGKVPPFDARNTGIGYYSYFGNPRLTTYSFTLRRSF